MYTSNTLHHLKELCLDSQRIHKTAYKLHAHSVHYAHKLTTTKRALKETKCSQGLGLEQGAGSHPPDLHQLSFPLETHSTYGQCVSFFLKMHLAAKCLLSFS